VRANYFPLFRLASASASRFRSAAFWVRKVSRGLVGCPTSSSPVEGIKPARILSTKVKCLPCLIWFSILSLSLSGILYSAKWVDYPYMLRVIVSEIKGEEWTCLDLDGDRWRSVPQCVEGEETEGDYSGDDQV
jgi:hypothetical protein